MSEDKRTEAAGAPLPKVTVSPERTHVCVLSGGWSDEREISRESGRQCADALREAGFVVTELDPAAKGFFESFAELGPDVAYVAMHGRYGEDGCVQGYLELMDVPYTFSGVRAQALAMEKHLTKYVYEQAGIPMPAGLPLSVSEALVTPGQQASIERLGVPLIVKPAANGSSIGVSRIDDIRDLPRAVEEAGRGGQFVLVEECLEGMEITVPVIGNGEPMALPVIEIVTGAQFYDSTVKYEPSELHHVIPARLPDDVYARAQEYAVTAHRALGCAGCSRSDFIVTADGEPHILETNTIPGMTATSLLPDSARRMGIGFPELCRLFVEYALEAHPRRGRGRE